MAVYTHSCSPYLTVERQPLANRNHLRNVLDANRRQIFPLLSAPWYEDVWGEWNYNCANFSKLWQHLEVSDKLHAPCLLTPRKLVSSPIGYEAMLYSRTG